ncbi:MAG: Lon-like protease helical domain-containing protein, partial [Bacteroidota bacterium]
MAYLKAPRPKELKPDELKWTCKPDSLNFESFESIKPIEGIIGQERALKALKIGVDLKSPGYNIFITGLSGTGKLTTIKKMLETISPQRAQLKDYAYVNSFKDSDRPTLLTFPAGKGKKFKKDFADVIKFLLDSIPQLLDNEPFVSVKKKVLAEFGSAQQSMMTQFEKKLQKDNFTLGQVKVGELTRPEILAVIDKEPIFIQQLDEYVKSEKITEKKAEQIVKKYATYQEELQSVFKKGLKLTQEFQEKVLQIEKDAVADLVNVSIGELIKAQKIKSAEEYLMQVAEDILLNLDVFKGQKPAQEKTSEGYYVDYLKVYDVNLI